MTIRPGERQVARSRTALKTAFEGLLREKRYGEIAVGEIVDRADVGRSTFYRHFKGKADVLLALHEDTFGQIFLDAISQDTWLADHPPPSLKEFLEQHHASSGPMVSLSSDIQADADYIMMNVTRLLTEYVEKGLQQAFPDVESSIPLPVLASSIAGIYVMILMSWKVAYRDITGHQMAEYVHLLSRASIREAFGVDCQ